MYQKTGQSIKRVAEIFAYIGVIVSCIASVGAYRLVWALTGGSSYHNGNYGFSIISAIVVLVVGILLAWLSNLVLAGFGELVDRVCSIDSSVQKYLSSQSVDSDQSTHK